MILCTPLIKRSMCFPYRDAFEEGEVILKEYETFQGSIEIAGEVRIEDEGKTLHIENVSIFPKNERKLEIGNREVISIRDRLAEEAKAEGFEKLRLTGKRVSGATFDGNLTSGKKVDITIDLTK